MLVSRSNATVQNLTHHSPTVSFSLSGSPSLLVATLGLPYETLGIILVFSCPSVVDSHSQCLL